MFKIYLLLLLFFYIKYSFLFFPYTFLGLFTAIDTEPSEFEKGCYEESTQCAQNMLISISDTKLNPAQASSSLNMNRSATNSSNILFSRSSTSDVIPFVGKSLEQQQKILLSWITENHDLDAYFYHNVKIKNIENCLDKLLSNKLHNRLCRVNINIIKNFVTEISWKVLSAFIKEHEEDTDICRRCESNIPSDASFYVCHSCLLCFHSICDPEHKLQSNDEICVCRDCRLKKQNWNYY